MTFSFPTFISDVREEEPSHCAPSFSCLPSTHPFTLASDCTHVQFPAFREKDENFCHEKISRKLGETVRENFVSFRFLFVLFVRTVHFICYVCSYVPFVSHLGKKHFTT